MSQGKKQLQLIRGPDSSTHFLSYWPVLFFLDSENSGGNHQMHGSMSLLQVNRHLKKSINTDFKPQGALDCYDPFGTLKKKWIDIYLMILST